MKSDSLSKPKFWLPSFFAALVTFAVLVSLHPFGIDQYGNLWAYSAAVGVIVFVVCYAVILVHNRFRHSGKSMMRIRAATFIGMTIIIGLLVSLLQVAMWGISASTAMVGLNLLDSLFITAIVYGMTFLVRHNKDLRTELEEEKELNRSIRQRLEALDAMRQKSKGQDEPSRPAAETEPTIKLMGSTKKQIEIRIADFIYAGSVGNYVEVAFIAADGKQRKEALRQTMKELESQLEGYPYIVRCHRAFMVNINRIRSAKGNSQGYTLTLDGSPDTVPVSRTYTSAIKTMLSTTPTA